LSEQNTRDIGGVPNDVIYSDGVGSFNGESSYIDFPLNFNGTYSVRIKITTTTFALFQYLLDARKNSSIGFVYIYKTSGAIFKTSGVSYINGEVSSQTTLNEEQEIVISGIYISSSVLTIFSQYAHGTALNGTGNLFEIYEGTLTAEEVKNLYEGERYRDISPQTSTHKKVLNIDSRRGAIYDQYGNVITNTDVEVVRDGKIYVEKYDGGTSRLDTGSDLVGVDGVTFLVRIKPFTFGGGNRGRIINNNKFWVETLGSNQNILLTSNGSGNLQSAVGSVILNKWMLVGVTRTSDGIGNMYLDGIISGTPNTNTGTPVAGTTNIFIGADSIGNNEFDGLMGRKRIIKGILSPEEISQIYTNEKQFYSN